MLSPPPISLKENYMIQRKNHACGHNNKDKKKKTVQYKPKTLKTKEKCFE